MTNFIIGLLYVILYWMIGLVISGLIFLCTNKKVENLSFEELMGGVLISFLYPVVIPVLAIFVVGAIVMYSVWKLIEKIFEG